MSETTEKRLNWSSADNLTPEFLGIALVGTQYLTCEVAEFRSRCVKHERGMQIQAMGAGCGSRGDSRFPIERAQLRMLKVTHASPRSLFWQLASFSTQLYRLLDTAVVAAPQLREPP